MRRPRHVPDDLGEPDPAALPYRPGDLYRFSMTADEVAAAGAGVVPLRIRRACFIATPCLVDGNHEEHYRRMLAERDGTLDALMRSTPGPLRDPRRLWALVQSQRVALYAAGLITADEWAALLEDEDR